VIINPPFGLDQSLHRELGFAAGLLEPGRRDQPVLLDWPVPEA
jgi:hypothetical protein